MGTTPTPHAAESNIGCAYLAKVLQGVKREVDSKVEIECSSTREAYDQWRRNFQNYKEKIQKAFPSDAAAISNSLLFPSSTLYDSNGSICGDKQGKVVLEYASGFLSLQESKSLHIQENMPFTSSEIWNLLFSMAEYNLMIKRTTLLLELRTESLYTDLRTKIIKLRNPFSFFGSELKCRHEKYVDTEKLGLVVRGLKVPREIEQRNDVFNIGMILVEVMLLESCCLIYDDGLSHHKTINPALHEMLIEKVLKLAYYPLKLRMIVAGLIQLHSNDRFTCEEVYELLGEFKEKIKNFHSFHLRKTAFQNVFKHKLIVLEFSISKIKQECNAELFKEGITFTSATESRPTKHISYPVSPFPKNTPNLETPSHMDHSLNFSITNLAHTNRHGDLESLNLSKSENRSFILQQKSSVKEKSIATSNNGNNTDLVRHSEKSAQSLPMASTVPVAPKAPTLDKLDSPKTIPHQSGYSQPPPELTPTPEGDISNPFENFQPEKQSMDNISQSSKSNHSNKTPQRPIPQGQPEQHSSSLKVQEESSQPIKNLVTPDLRLSANLELIESEKKISVQAGRESEQQEEGISCIQQNQQNQSENGESRNSSVVEYVSELYETERAVEPPAEVGKTEKQEVAGEGRRRWETEKEVQLFDSCGPHRLFIKKTESYEFQSNSHSSIIECPPRAVVHQASIIDRLSPLVNSKKTIADDTYRPDNLTESARKRIDYWNTFSKFSPEVIAQLHLPARYPDNERLKRSMRETISYHNIAMGKTKKMFPEPERGSAGEEPFSTPTD